MGGTSSVYRDHPLRLPQADFVGTIHKRFVKSHQLTLELQPQFWTQQRDHDSVICDVKTGQVVFKVGPIQDDHGQEKRTSRRLLLDAYGVAIAGMECQDLPPSSAQYFVIPGGGSTPSTDYMGTINTRINPSERPMEMLFNDPVTNKQVLIGIRGKWITRDAIISMTIGQNAREYGIARIYCDGNPLDSAFCMDVAPGVDAALMVLIAAALEYFCFLVEYYIIFYTT